MLAKFQYFSFLSTNDLIYQTQKSILTLVVLELTQKQVNTAIIAKKTETPL